MDPSVVVAGPGKAPSRLHNLNLKRWLISAILILAVAALGAYLLPKLISQVASPKSGSFITNYSLDLNKNIQEAFGSSNKFKDITELNQIAYSEPNLEKKYKYYSLLFSKVSQAYQQTKKIEFKTILLQIKDYMKASPEYNEGDFNIPK